MEYKIYIIYVIYNVVEPNNIDQRWKISYTHLLVFKNDPFQNVEA